MRAGNFNPIHCFPHKKNFVNEGVEILLLSIGLVKFIFGIFDNDAGRLECMTLRKDGGKLTITFTQTDSSTCVLVDTLTF